MKISFKNFKSYYSKTEIDLSDFNVIIGKNSSGKSSLSEAIREYSNFYSSKFSLPNSKSPIAEITSSGIETQIDEVTKSLIDEGYSFLKESPFELPFKLIDERNSIYMKQHKLGVDYEKIRTILSYKNWKNSLHFTYSTQVGLNPSLFKEFYNPEGENYIFDGLNIISRISSLETKINDKKKQIDDFKIILEETDEEIREGLNQQQEDLIESKLFQKLDSPNKLFNIKEIVSDRDSYLKTLDKLIDDNNLPQFHLPKSTIQTLERKHRHRPSRNIQTLISEANENLYLLTSEKESLEKKLKNGNFNTSGEGELDNPILIPQKFQDLGLSLNLYTKLNDFSIELHNALKFLEYHIKSKTSKPIFDDPDSNWDISYAVVKELIEVNLIEKPNFSLYTLRSNKNALKHLDGLNIFSRINSKESIYFDMKEDKLSYETIFYFEKDSYMYKKFDQLVDEITSDVFKGLIDKKLSTFSSLNCINRRFKQNIISEETEYSKSFYYKENENGRQKIEKNLFFKNTERYSSKLNRIIPNNMEHINLMNFARNDTKNTILTLSTFTNYLNKKMSFLKDSFYYNNKELDYYVDRSFSDKIIETKDNKSSRSFKKSLAEAFGLKSHLFFHSNDLNQNYKTVEYNRFSENLLTDEEFKNMSLFSNNLFFHNIILSNYIVHFKKFLSKFVEQSKPVFNSKGYFNTQDYNYDYIRKISSKSGTPHFFLKQMLYNIQFEHYQSLLRDFQMNVRKLLWGNYNNFLKSLTFEDDNTFSSLIVRPQPLRRGQQIFNSKEMIEWLGPYFSKIVSEIETNTNVNKSLKHVLLDKYEGQINYNLGLCNQQFRIRIIPLFSQRDSNLIFLDKFEVLLVDLKDKSERSLAFSGSGDSALVSLIASIVMTDKREINSDLYITIQEPENYFHPNLCAEVIEYLFEKFSQNMHLSMSKTKFIIETHSEVVLRKVQSLTKKSKKKNKSKVYYIDKQKNSSFVKDLELQDDGFLLNKIPQGFFDINTNLINDLWEMDNEEV